MNANSLWERIRKFIFRVRLSRAKRDVKKHNGDINNFSHIWDFKITLGTQSEKINPENQEEA